MGCELCEAFSLLLDFKGTSLSLPRRFPHQGRQNMPAHLYLLLGRRCLSLAHQAFITLLVFVSQALLRRTPGKVLTA